MLILLLGLLISISDGANKYNQKIPDAKNEG